MLSSSHDSLSSRTKNRKIQRKDFKEKRTLAYFDDFYYKVGQTRFSHKTELPFILSTRASLPSTVSQNKSEKFKDQIFNKFESVGHILACQ